MNRITVVVLGVLLSGCVTGKDKQLAEYEHRQAKNILKEGAEPGALKSQMLVKSTKRTWDAVDPNHEAEPLIVDEKNPGLTDARIIDQAIEDAEKEEAKYLGWIALAVSVVMGGYGGKRVIGGVLAFRNRGRLVDQLSGALVCVVEKLKPKVKDGIDVPQIVHDTTREHGVKVVVDNKFEQVKNGGTTT